MTNLTAPTVAIVSCSLNSESVSRVLALDAQRVLKDAGVSTVFIDLREHPLPLCDGEASYSDPRVSALNARLTAASGILMAVPVYNFDSNAASKNLIELTGSAWENKVVGFLCAAGGMSSYMSVMSFANSLMLDFRSIIVPRFVYATGAAVEGDRIVNADIRQRVAELANSTARMASALASVV